MNKYADRQPCTACQRPYDGGPAAGRRTWWHCNNYFKFSGFFCPDCYDKISHNGYNQPNDPEGYLMMTIKLGTNEHASV